ncbi:MAG TPA: S41 family peptidase [Anaerolineales bacterium]|nr:S41 family peptidase [Anaerolineales bacterium]
MPPMRLKRIPLIVLLVTVLACSFVTQNLDVLPPTPTATSTVPATSTATATQVYIPSDCDGTQLATLAPATLLAPPTPAIQANPPVAPDLQLKIFDETAQIILDNYVYPDFNGKDWSAIVASHRASIQAGLSTKGFYEVMQSLVEDLGDEHSRFDSPVEVAESDAELNGTSQFVGIGVSIFTMADKNKLTIAGVFPGSPAEHAGLKVHDSILAVDSFPVMQGGQIYSSRIRGPECSAARLTVQSPGEASRDVMLLRHRIQGDIPIEAHLLPTTDGSHVGYIVLPSFYDEKIPQEVSAALQQFGTLDGLILDNRTNFGGSSDIVDRVLSHFAAGTLGTFHSRTEARPLTIQPDPIANSQKVPLVVLVGLDTASFGEISAGVLQDSGRARVVGERTLGNVELLYAHGLTDGSRLWLAEERFDPAVSHANWEATGIVPDVVAYADWDTFTSDNDPGIHAALRLLGHAAAGSPP